MRKAAFLLATLLGSCSITPCLAGYLTPREKAAIQNNRPEYEWAAGCAGVPWQALAAIHVRESDLVRIPGCIGGAFMLDCGGKGNEFDQRIRSREEWIVRKYQYLGPGPSIYEPAFGRHYSVEDNFRFACLVAADELRGVDEDVLADALWGYNGRYSACVANNPKRDWVLEVRYTDRGGNLHSYQDGRPGTLVLYREIVSCSLFQ